MVCFRAQPGAVLSVAVLCASTKCEEASLPTAMQARRAQRPFQTFRNPSFLNLLRRVVHSLSGIVESDCHVPEDPGCVHHVCVSIFFCCSSRAVTVGRLDSFTQGTELDMYMAHWIQPEAWGKSLARSEVAFRRFQDVCAAAPSRQGTTAAPQEKSTARRGISCGRSASAAQCSSNLFSPWLPVDGSGLPGFGGIG